MNKKHKIRWKIIKLKNRRVSLGHVLRDKSPYKYGHWVRYKILDSTMPKGKRILVTEFRLSDEAFQATNRLFIDELSGRHRNPIDISEIIL